MSALTSSRKGERALVGGLWLTLVWPSIAGAAVYKCTEGGQVVFTDRPCVYTAPVAKADTRQVPVPIRVADPRAVVPGRELATTVSSPR